MSRDAPRQEAAVDLDRDHATQTSLNPPQKEPLSGMRDSSAVRATKKAVEDSGPGQNVTELKDYQLGDCLGKGAFGSVYRALNMGTGETVAVKQVKLADLPKSELRVITLEIDLLKNLDASTSTNAVDDAFLLTSFSIPILSSTMGSSSQRNR
ncbi:Protein kinase of the Mitotic Exit Network [Xanthoria calcicola]